MLDEETTAGVAYRRDMSITELDEEIMIASRANKKETMTQLAVDPQLANDIAALKKGQKNAEGIDVKRQKDNYWRRYDDRQLTYAFRRSSAQANLMLAKNLRLVARAEVKDLSSRGDERSEVVIKRETEALNKLKLTVDKADDRIHKVRQETAETFLDPEVARMPWKCTTCEEKAERYWGCDNTCYKCREYEAEWNAGLPNEIMEIPPCDQAGWRTDDGKRSFDVKACKWCKSPKPDDDNLMKVAAPLLWKKNKAAINNIAESERRAVTKIELYRKWVIKMEEQTPTEQETSLPDHWEMVEAPRGIVDDDSEVEVEMKPKKSYMADVENMRTTQFEEENRRADQSGLRRKRREHDGDDEDDEEVYKNFKRTAPWHKHSKDVVGVDERLYKGGTRRTVPGDKRSAKRSLSTGETKWQRDENNCRGRCPKCNENCKLRPKHRGSCDCKDSGRCKMLVNRQTTSAHFRDDKRARKSRSMQDVADTFEELSKARAIPPPPSIQSPTGFIRLVKGLNRKK